MARKKKETNKHLLWAEHEVELACRKKNSNDNGDDGHDYLQACYDVALSAYEKCIKGNLTGAQFPVMTTILERLLHNQPLMPITDADFLKEGFSAEELSIMSPDDLRREGYRSYIQCRRCMSVFRIEYLDGRIRYKDLDRGYFVDIDNPSNKYMSDMSFLDDMYPIRMPYYPSLKKFVIYERTFLTDEKNGDYDTKGTLYMLTPDGERVDLNIYRTEMNGTMVRISKEDFDALYEKRIYKKQG